MNRRFKKTTKKEKGFKNFRHFKNKAQLPILITVNNKTLLPQCVSPRGLCAAGIPCARCLLFFFPYSASISHVDEVFVTTMFNHTTTSTWVLKRFTQMFPFNIFATVANAEISYLMEMTYIFFSFVEFFL